MSVNSFMYKQDHAREERIKFHIPRMHSLCCFHFTLVGSSFDQGALSNTSNCGHVICLYLRKGRLLDLADPSDRKRTLQEIMGSFRLRLMMMAGVNVYLSTYFLYKYTGMYIPATVRLDNIVKRN